MTTNRHVVAVVGSRTCPEMPSLLDNVLFDLLSKHPTMLLVSGGARGADRAAEIWAKLHGVRISVFKADWAKYGKMAGTIRNRLIVEASDEVVAIWNGRSKGTKSTMDLAAKANKKVTIITIP